jgi:hypothetical protein
MLRRDALLTQRVADALSEIVASNGRDLSPRQLEHLASKDMLARFRRVVAEASVQFAIIR